MKKWAYVKVTGLGLLEEIQHQSSGGIADARLDFGSFTAKELRVVQTAADEAARESARQAAEHVIEDRRKAEIASLRKRLKELSA